MTDLTDYEDRMSGYDPTMYLGRVCWYAISQNERIDHAQFCRLVHDHNMNWPLPPVPRVVDVYRRATTAAQRRRIPTADPNVFINYLTREVGSNVDQVFRRLVAETVDTEGHTLGYEEVYEFILDRNPGVLHTRPLGISGPIVNEIVAQVFETWQNENNMLTANVLRGFVRNMLHRRHATMLRDGVYFVREAYADEMVALEAIVNSFPQSSMHSLPLADDRKQRDMLKQAFEDESVGEIDRMLGEISEILQSDKKVSSDRFADFKVQYDSLRSKVADYSDLLDEALAMTGARLEIMNEALFTLLGRVKA